MNESPGIWDVKNGLEKEGYTYICEIKYLVIASCLLFDCVSILSMFTQYMFLRLSRKTWLML